MKLTLFTSMTFYFIKGTKYKQVQITHLRGDTVCMLGNVGAVMKMNTSGEIKADMSALLLDL